MHTGELFHLWNTIVRINYSTCQTYYCFDRILPEYVIQPTRFTRECSSVEQTISHLTRRVMLQSGYIRMYEIGKDNIDQGAA